MNEPNEAPRPDEPREGQLYERNGKPFLFVRSEQRPGADQLEYQYVSAWNRMIHTHWTPEPLPAGDLLHDTEGRAQAVEHQWETWVARLEIDLLVDLLKKACDLLPKQRADDLRREYSERKATVLD